MDMPLHKRVNIILNAYAAAVLLSFFLSSPGFAQDGIGMNLEHDAIEAEEVEPIVSDFQHYYEDITRQSLAKLYWRLGALDVNNKDHVDTFMRITECDIFKDYFYDEFQWEKIRQRARNFLSENAELFTARYKFVQPLRFGEYDIAKGLFHITEDFQIDSITKYEVASLNLSEKLCGSFYKEIKNYPGALIATLSQPFTLKAIPMEPGRARKYITEKNKQFEKLSIQRKTKENLYKYRDAYLVMKVRFFDYRGEYFASFSNYNTALVNAVLEGYEIYSDTNHTDLLYYQNFLRKDREQSNQTRLKEQYEEMLRRRKKADEKLKEKFDNQ